MLMLKIHVMQFAYLFLIWWTWRAQNVLQRPEQRVFV